MAFSTLVKTLKTDWVPALTEINADQLPILDEFLETEKKIYGKHLACYPPPELILNAFNHFDVADTKVIILGQDPYIRKGQAMGLSFSVPEGTPLPPSLKNIYIELQKDLDEEELRTSGDLSGWCDQGVMLLNTALTVREGDSNSHKNEWKTFTDRVIKYISDKCDYVVFVLWGSPAQKKIKFIDTDKHGIVKCPHPSPLSAYRGFFGSRSFSKTNELLVEQGREPVKW